MTSVSVNTYTHSVTYVTDNLLKSVKDVIRLSGLDPQLFVGSWASNQRGMSVLLESGHLTRVVLEIFDPADDGLVVRWDMDIVYSFSGDGSFYTDTEQLKYHIRKAGLTPSQAQYRMLLLHSAGAPDVPGWSTTTLRSTDGFTRQSLGSTIDHSGLGAGASYWRKNS